MTCVTEYKRLLTSVALVALLGFAMLCGIRWWVQPRYFGRTMAQWLNILTSEPGRSGSPLDIIRTHVDTSLHTVVLEVPLSYDLLREHDFLWGQGFIDVRIDGRASVDPIPELRGTNGNCFLVLNWDREQIPPGLHKFQVNLRIGKDLNASGSTQCVVPNNNPRSGSPLDIVCTHVDTNLDSTVLEVPLSYDLLRENDFLDGRRTIDVIIDDRIHRSVPRSRGENGNCLLVLDWDREQIPPGVHELRVVLRIADYIYAIGSPRAVAFNRHPTSH